MTTPSIRDRVNGLDYGPAPAPFAISDVIASGRRQRTRRRCIRGAAGVVGVAAVVLAGMATPLSTRGSGAARLGTAAALETAPPYWHLRFSETVTITQNGEKVNHDPDVYAQTWEGNNQPSWSASETQPAKPPVQLSAYTPFDGHTVSWDYLYALPASASALRQNIETEYGEPDAPDFAAAVLNLIYEPGPDAVKLAAAQLLSETPGVTSSTGPDQKGRATKVFTIHFPTGQTETAFVDPSTGRMLEEISRSTGSSGNIPEVNVTTMVWDQVGPTNDHNSLPTGP